MMELAKAGLGVALLPVVLARDEAGLIPWGPVPQAGLGFDVWLLTHPDLKRAERVRAAMAFLGAAIPQTLRL